MKPPISFEVGRVVYSKQGRDQGRYFVIVDVVDDQFVLMADGALRKVSRPKRKKVKHLHPKPWLLQDIRETLLAGRQPMDSDIRKALKQMVDV